MLVGGGMTGVCRNDNINFNVSVGSNVYVIQVCFRTAFVMLTGTWNFLLRLSLNMSEQPDGHICPLQQRAACFRAFHFMLTKVPQP